MRCNAMGGVGAATTLEALYYAAVAAMPTREASGMGRWALCFNMTSAYDPRLSNTASTTTP